MQTPEATRQLTKMLCVDDDNGEMSTLKTQTTDYRQLTQEEVQGTLQILAGDASKLFKE
jgi:hypothetical protein